MNSTLEYVLTTVAKVKGVSLLTLDAETQLSGLELDSLDEVEVMMLLEEELGIEIDQALISGCKTIGDVASALDSIGASRQRSEV